jgi:hypothetical protein
LDELLLTHEAIIQRSKELFKFHAALQGIEVPDDEDHDDGDSLPEELLEIERRRSEERKKERESHEADELKELGLGYELKS